MDSVSQDFFQMLRNLLTQLPSLLTLLVCLGIALFRWRHHPKVSLVASLAFIFHILQGLFFSAAYIVIPRWFLASSGAETNQRFFVGLRLVGSLLFAVWLALLLLAVFMDRRPRHDVALAGSRS